jgi:ParB family chromosome partitioning protein
MLSFIPLDHIRENPHQPRKEFDEEKLSSLAESITHLGLLQPILVTKVVDGYQLIAGERRLRAAKLAGLETIAAIVREKSLVAEEALAENLQREALSPLEIAASLEAMLRQTTQEILAKRLGIKRSTIANFVRLLSLPEPVKKALGQEMITMGHAKALLQAEDPEKLLPQVIENKWSVRQTEKVASLKKDPTLTHAEGSLEERLCTRVEITRDRIIIDYYGFDDLDRLLNYFGVSLC